jgi:hypothetical protein
MFIVLGMEVRRIMLVEKHIDHDSQKTTDLRHVSSSFLFYSSIIYSLSRFPALQISVAPLMLTKISWGGELDDVPENVKL